MLFSRRALGRAALSAVPAPALLARPKIPVAVQLYSVRKIAEADLAGTLAKVARLGYRGVEFAGYYNHDAKTIRKLLDDSGLQAAGTHTSLQSLLEDNLPKTIEFNKTIGNKYLIVPGLPPLYRDTIKAWHDTAEIFTDLAVRLRAEEMRVGLHNHTVEFERIEGKIPLYEFLNNTPVDVIAQLDIGHARRAGVDPAAFIRAYPKRFVTVHVKDFHPTNKAALVGEGEVRWKDVFRELESKGGVEWYIIEEESGAYPGLEGIAKSLERMKKMGKA
jgi:sugar phosphate isomerase/epimerase